MHFIKKMFLCHTSNIPITLNKHLNQRYSFTIKYVGIPLLASIPKFSRNLPRASGAIANVGIIYPFIRAWPITFPIIRECFKSWVKDDYRLAQGFFVHVFFHFSPIIARFFIINQGCSFWLKLIWRWSRNVRRFQAY